MAILPILRFPDPRLRRPCTPVTQLDDRLRQLAADMLDTMYAAPGRGLAGPQIGVMQRIFVMDTTWKEGAPSPRVCLNPEILAASDDLVTRTEGCLSIPGVDCPVARPAEITLRWTDLSGAILEEHLTGFAATCAQHELDHLNGRLCIDLLDEPARVAASVALAAMGRPA
ncbi:peptide deformylase [Gemmobacter nectariphilus]|uniref:peptide deformylase n=1 Tax=Gemmobacter nectariphilus TaxID=220343 RepID=UPI00041D3858|nr:peptide deformylase [Gemmobacter nectariphilus]